MSRKITNFANEYGNDTKHNRRCMYVYVHHNLCDECFIVHFASCHF